MLWNIFLSILVLYTSENLNNAHLGKLKAGSGAGVDTVTGK